MRLNEHYIGNECIERSNCDIYTTDIMNMKRTQLKEAIKQIVRKAINERKIMIREEAPPGRKAERAVMHVKKTLRDKHPEWDDEKITSVAIATAWKLHNKGSLEEDDKAPNIKKAGKLNPKIVGKDNKLKASYSGSETNPIRKAGKLGFGLKQEAGLTSENGNYSEEAELELIKQIGQKVLELLAMHGAGTSATGTSPAANEPEEHEPEGFDTTPNPFEKPDDTEPADNDDSGEEIETGEEETEDELDEAAAGQKKVKCKKCGKSFIPNYGEYSRCQSCLTSQHSAAEKATGV